MQVAIRTVFRVLRTVCRCYKIRTSFRVLLEMGFRMVYNDITTSGKRGGKEYGMALVCINGAKECCGCGNCFENGDNSQYMCQFCGKALGRDERYKNSLFEVLCSKCLLRLHKV